MEYHIQVHPLDATHYSMCTLNDNHQVTRQILVEFHKNAAGNKTNSSVHFSGMEIRKCFTKG